MFVSHGDEEASAMWAGTDGGEKREQDWQEGSPVCLVPM